MRFKKAIYASLAERGLTIAEIAELSPYQKLNIYWHPRKDGNIKWPEAPASVKEVDTVEGELEVLSNDMLRQILPAEYLEELKEKVKERYAAKNGEAVPNRNKGRQ